MTDELEYSNEDYKKFFEETPVALLKISIKTGKFLMVNKFAAELLGCQSTEELLTKYKITDFYKNEDFKKLVNIIKKKGVIENYEIKLNSGSKIIWASSRLKISEGGNSIEGSLIDTTALVEMKEKYLLAMKELSCKIDKKLASIK